MALLKEDYSIHHVQLLHFEELLNILETPLYLRGFKCLFDRNMLLIFVVLPLSIVVMISIMEEFHWAYLSFLLSMMGMFISSAILSGYLFARRDDAAWSLDLVNLIMRVYEPVNPANQKMFLEAMQSYLADKNINKMTRKNIIEITLRIRT